MNSFFAPASQKKAGPVSWRVLEKGLVIGKHSPESTSTTLPSKNRKVAAFDLVSLCSNSNYQCALEGKNILLTYLCE